MPAIDEIRAQHRTECVGLVWCDDHPVPHVMVVGWWDETAFLVCGSPDGQAQPYEDTFAEALAAARRLTKEMT